MITRPRLTAALLLLVMIIAFVVGTFAFRGLYVDGSGVHEIGTVAP